VLGKFVYTARGGCKLALWLRQPEAMGGERGHTGLARRGLLGKGGGGRGSESNLRTKCIFLKIFQSFPKKQRFQWFRCVMYTESIKH
jgi:hypothetical protein